MRFFSYIRQVAKDKISSSEIVLKELHEKVARGHFVVDITTKKILDVGYWWPTLFKDIHDFCKSYDSCQKIRRVETKSLTKLVITLPEEPFMKWGLDFICLIKPTRRIIKKKHFGSYRLCNQVGRSKGI